MNLNQNLQFNQNIRKNIQTHDVYKGDTNYDDGKSRKIFVSVKLQLSRR